MARKAKDSNGVYVSPDFECYSLAVTDEEEKFLRASLEAEGCREPLYILANDGAILDGHRRYRHCKELKIPFKTKALRFEDRGAAQNWVIDEQLARRNLTDIQKKLLMGRRYRAEKKQGERADLEAESSKNTEKNGDLTSAQIEQKLDAATQIGEEYGVSSATVRRGADLADAVDSIAEVAPEVADAIESGQVKVTQSTVEAVAELPKKERRKAAKQIAAGEQPTLPAKPKPKAAPKPKSGSTVASFNMLYEYIGKTAPKIDALAKVKPGDKWARRLQNYVEEALKIVNEWKHACR